MMGSNERSLAAIVTGVVLGLTVVLAVAVPVQAQLEESEPPPATRPADSRPGVDQEAASERADGLRQISDRLICQCGCNMVLSECSHQSCPFALPEREKILARIDAGGTEDEIVDEYVADFGRTILSAPPTDGTWLDLLAWILPALALGFGVIVVARVVRDLARPRTSSPADKAVDDDPFLARAREDFSRSQEDE